MPTPEQWAAQQLRRAPQRSAEWAGEVARIWCLDISDDSGEATDKQAS